METYNVLIINFTTDDIHNFYKRQYEVKINNVKSLINIKLIYYKDFLYEILLQDDFDGFILHWDHLNEEKYNVMTTIIELFNEYNVKYYLTESIGMKNQIYNIYDDKIYYYYYSQNKLTLLYRDSDSDRDLELKKLLEFR